LRPVAEHAARIDDAEKRIEAWRSLQELTQPYYATGHLNLLRAQELELRKSLAVTEEVRDETEQRISAHHIERDGLNAAIRHNRCRFAAAGDRTGTVPRRTFAENRQSAPCPIGTRSGTSGNGVKPGQRNSVYANTARVGRAGTQ
jgi:hypothetical protein